MNESQKKIEVIEKTDILTNNPPKMPSNLPSVLQSDVKEIYTHFANGTMSVEIFTQFVTNINESFGSRVASNHKATSEQTEPDINVAELIAKDQLVTVFNHIKGQTPKTKLCISFYSKFLTIVSQTKHDQDAMKNVIFYSDIVSIICVPEKNDNIILYAKLNKTISLKFKKQKIEHLVLTFPYDEETEERDLCNLNTPITANKLNETKEANFCRVFSDLCQKSIERQDEKLFRRSLESKKKVFFISPTIGYNKCELYPLRSGLFFTPKPMRFVAISDIKYYEFARRDHGCRYYDISVVLYCNEEENKINEAAENQNNKRKKNKKKANKIDLNMIEKKECNELVGYFQLMRIKEKKEGMASPDRKKQIENENANNKNDKKEEDDSEKTDDDEDDSEFSGSDEEYKMEEDDYDYSGSESCEDDDDADDDDDEDIDMSELAAEVDHVNANCAKVESGQDLSEKVKRNNRKRKRDEVDDENVSNEENVNNANVMSPMSPRKKIRRVNIHRNICRNIVRSGSGSSIGVARKSVQEDAKKIVSKVVDKKKSPIKKRENKKAEDTDDNDEDEIEILSVKSSKKKKKSKDKKRKKKKKEDKDKKISDFFAKSS